MRIISKFHDYYDYISHQYGADNMIVYNRQPFESSEELKKMVLKVMWDIRYKQGYIAEYNSYVDRRTRWLVVNGLLYLLVKKSTDTKFKLLTEESLAEFIHDIKTRRHAYFRDKYKISDFIGVDVCKDALIPIHNIINQPIFVVEFYGKQDLDFGDFTYDGGVIRYYAPVLSELGFPSIYPAEQLYQDISYFIGNEMKPSPDIKPPVEISNDNKIEGHGFDLKQSFRHRK